MGFLVTVKAEKSGQRESDGLSGLLAIADKFYSWLFNSYTH
jgi:hypothetical protein